MTSAPNPATSSDRERNAHTPAAAPPGRMTDGIRSDLSSHDATGVTVRDRDLVTEVMGELDFASTVHLLLTGDDPTEAEARLVDAMLTSLMVHGTTPHAIAARMTLHSEPQAVQAAVASGLLGVGSRFAGAMLESARALQALAAADDDDAVAALVSTYREEGDRFAGIGHPHFDPVDPRAERLFDLARDADVAGEHVDRLHAVRDEFAAQTGAELPVNVTGAIAAITSDLGLPPEAARGFAIVSRAAGLVAEVVEEAEDPMAGAIWRFVDEHVQDGN